MPNTAGSRGARLRARAAALVCVALVAGACSNTADKLLTVTTPSRLADEQYLVPQNASLIVNSAIADYECAQGVYDVVSGLSSGELYDASQTASRWYYDRRDVPTSEAVYSTASCTGLGVYTPISTARFTTDQALRALDTWTDAQVPNRARLAATAALYAGFSYILLGEGFCTAAVNAGPELQTAQILDSAEARFTRTISFATAPADSQLLRAAYVGRARARLDKGNKAGAADDAAKVPVGFVFNATADNLAARRNNRVFDQNNGGASGVTVAVAYRGLTVGGVADPRVPVKDEGRVSGDQVNRWFSQQKYPTLTTPIPIATGIEAQLILAEAQGAAQGVPILNALRARVGLAPLTAAETADFQGTIYSERARWLFLQGNRWFDVRRGNLTQLPAAGTPYPKGGVYGTERCWPLPDVERAANPNLGS